MELEITLHSMPIYEDYSQILILFLINTTNPVSFWKTLNIFRLTDFGLPVVAEV